MTRQLSIPVPEGLLRGEESGTGSALVLLHGFSFDMSLWDPQFGEFARRHRTVRYDLRGFGRSGRPAAGRGHVADLLAVLDALGIQRAHPVRVGGVVLASPGLPGYRWTAPRPPEQAARVARERGIAAAKEYWLGHEIFRSADGHPRARGHLAEMVGRFPAHQWGDGPAAEPLPPLAGRLTGVRAPVLVLNGSLDIPGYREIAACLHREIPGAGRHELAGAGHLLNLELPATFNDQVVSFLAHLDGPAPAPRRAGSDRAARQ